MVSRRVGIATATEGSSLRAASHPRRASCRSTRRGGASPLLLFPTQKSDPVLPRALKRKHRGPSYSQGPTNCSICARAANPCSTPDPFPPHLLQTLEQPNTGKFNRFIAPLCCMISSEVMVLLKQQKNDEFSPFSNSDQLDVENENSAGFGTPEDLKRPKEGQQPVLRIAEDFSARDDPKLQAKGANVKHWACANFSSIGGEELLRFLHSLSRTCVDIGMHDFKLEPAMMVCMCSPSDADVEHGLWNVHEFFEHPELRKGQAKFLLVILPDTRCFDEQLEETCKTIGVAYQCCLPLYDKMTNKEYLKNAATEIKAKVIEFSKLSDSRMDTDLDDYGYEEMREDGYAGDGYGRDGYEGDGYGYEGDGYGGDGYEEDHNESGDYNSDSSDSEMSGQLLFPDEDSTAVTDAILKGKCPSTKTWACVNLSRIRHKRLLSFLSKLGNMLSFGVDASLEPVLSIHLNTTREIDIHRSLFTVFKFFYHLKVEKRATLLLVILPEDIFSRDG